MNTVNFGRSTNQARYTTCASSREFLTELHSFHERRRTAFRGVPMVNGRPVDLHELYLTVCALGGCRKVTEKNRWQQVCSKVVLPAVNAASGSANVEQTPSSCTNAAYACKLMYSRWLEAFERVHLFGQPDDPLYGGNSNGGSGAYSTSFGYFDDAFETPYAAATRARRSLVPTGVNTSIGASGLLETTGAQSASGFQMVADISTRRENGLSCEVRTSNEYERITLALLSGLPNEVDFAFNTLTILASSHRNESTAAAAQNAALDETGSGRKQRPSATDAQRSERELDFRHAPLLIDLLMAHIGFYSTSADSLFPLYTAWLHAARRNYFRFWWHATALPPCRSTRRYLFPRCFMHDSQNDYDSECEDDQDALGLLDKPEKALRDSPEAARVYQVAFILHAVSGDTHRADLLLSRDTVLRFLLVAGTFVHLLPLRRLALETLINLCASTRAMHAFLKDAARPNTTSDVKRRALLRFACTLLESADRDDVLAGLELLAAIAQGLQRPPPTANCSKGVQKHEAHSERATALMRLAVTHVDVVAPCHQLLLVADAALVVAALEALHALAVTKLRVFADHVASKWPQVLSLLVAFVSFDARALGRDAMRGVLVLRESVAVPAKHPRRERDRNAVPVHTLAPQPTSLSRVGVARPTAPPPAYVASRPAPPVADSRPQKPAATAVSAPTQTQAPLGGSQTQHGRATALQWLFLHCEMNDTVAPPAPSGSRSSRMAAAALAADVTSEANLYADYLHFVSSVPSRANPNVNTPCASCGSHLRCTCAAAKPNDAATQALSVTELKQIVRQVYPQIREAPGGGFFGLKLKSYLQSASKPRLAPVTSIPAANNTPATPTATPIVNGFSEKVLPSSNAEPRSSVALPQKRSLSPVPADAKQAASRTSVADSDELALGPPPKRGRGRPRKDRILAADGKEYIATPSGLRRPRTKVLTPREPVMDRSVTNGNAVGNRPSSRNETVECERNTIVEWRPDDTAMSVAPIVNGNDSLAKKDSIMRPEAPFIFAVPVHRRDTDMAPGLSTPANAETVLPSGLTREVIIERMKSKLERQRTERESFANASMNGGANGVIMNGDSPVVNGHAEKEPAGLRNVCLGDEMSDNTSRRPNGVAIDSVNEVSWSSRNGKHHEASPQMLTEHEADTQPADACKELNTCALNGFRSIIDCVESPSLAECNNEQSSTVPCPPAVAALTVGAGEAADPPSIFDIGNINQSESTFTALMACDVQVPRYACMWQVTPNDRCTCAYETLREVLAHAFSAHCNVPLSTCKWAGCTYADSNIQRSGYSLFMHLEDHHCREAAYAEQSPKPPAAPLRQSVVYPLNAALQAVRKLAPRPPFGELVDVPEGVLTKHIRVTAALVLQSLCDVSPFVRDALRKHMPTLAQLAFADRDASPVVARVLQRITKHEFSLPTVSASFDPSACASTSI